SELPPEGYIGPPGRPYIGQRKGERGMDLLRAAANVLFALALALLAAWAVFRGFPVTPRFEEYLAFVVSGGRHDLPAVAHPAAGPLR
ncbi:MAG: hypothetical protein LOD85_05180, partial [Clostridia bacterium]